MNYKLSIKLKALFLLIVFGLNTAVGFACALGMDMGFNTSHHNDKETPADIHVHADGKKHHHDQKSKKVSVHEHKDGNQHRHNNDTEPVKSVPGDKSSAAKNSGNCCSNEVQEFQYLDKNVSVNTGINVPVFLAILNTYFDIDFSTALKNFPVNYKARFFYPPPPDIRIAIQRFQI